MLIVSLVLRRLSGRGRRVFHERACNFCLIDIYGKSFEMSNLPDTASDVLDRGFLMFCCNGTCHDGVVREKVCVLGSQQNAMLTCGVAERPRGVFEWVLFGKWWCIAPLSVT